MIPTSVRVLEELPLNPNGKVDRRALAELEGEELEGERAPYVAPRTEVEETLVEIWADVLDLEPESVGVHDDFFRSGGHSLMATRLLSRVRRHFEVDVSLTDFFARSTLEELAERVEVARWARDGSGETGVEEIGTEEDFEEIEL